MVPEIDCLVERAPRYSISSEAGMICVVVPDFPLGPGYDRPVADLLLRLTPGYPDVPPAMWWFHPYVRHADGEPIHGTEIHERHLGHEWQRWSRHLQSSEWRSEIDSIESYLAIVREELADVARKAV